MIEIFWKCPSCKKIRKYEEKLIMKVCACCQTEMEVMGVIKNES